MMPYRIFFASGTRHSPNVTTTAAARTVPLRIAAGVFFVVTAFAITAACAFAATSSVPPEVKVALQAVYAKRADLQQAFNADGTAVPAMKAKGIASLEEWAQRYGSKEYPDTLGAYAAVSAAANAVPLTPAALTTRTAVLVPVRSTRAAFNFSRLSATGVIVIDDATRKVLLSRNADKPWPLASISKLMTAMVSIEHGLDFSGQGTIESADEVGGARLRVDPGTSLSVQDIFDAMLIGSANNAANAVARLSGLQKDDFVAAMNARAAQLGLASTTFVDPTGIEPANVSTARDVAALAYDAFSLQDVQRATTTASFTVQAASQTHVIKSTDGLLTDAGNGIQVLGGKTGFLYESKWNFVVDMKDSRNHPVTVAVLGSRTEKRSFTDAKLAAQWVWANYRWSKPATKK